MNRRVFLAGLSSSFLAGCGSYRPKTGALDDGETSVTTTQLADHIEYAVGEWHTIPTWRVTVSSLDLTATFHVDGVEREFEMLEDEQLVVATVRLENTTSETRGWAAGSFIILVDDTEYEPRRAFEHPAFSYAVDVSRLREVSHQEQFQTAGFGVASGETEELWLVAVVPQAVTREEIAVGFDGQFDDGVRYPVQWVPDGNAD